MSSAIAATPVEGATHASPVRQRIDSVDFVRGLVMVIMMLDHTRDYFHSAAFQYQPTNLDKTSVVLFFTRWITHFCAPVFFFLAGTGAYLRLQRGSTTGELSRFLLTRGLWLVFLEVTALQLLMFFKFDPGAVAVLTIWALGWSMIALSVLIRLPVKVVGAFGVALIMFHNLFDAMRVDAWAPGKPIPSVLQKLAMILHQPGLVPIGGSPKYVLFAGYSLVPWIGVMAAGFAFGSVYTLDATGRRRVLIRLGTFVTALFVVVRAINVYGDPARWSQQKSAVFTLLSFLNTTKYPPSLLYLCMTLGPAMLLLAFVEGKHRGWLGRAFVTFGRVPLFFYVGQWIVAHSIALIAYSLAGKPTNVLFGIPGFAPLAPEILANSGFSLGATYAAWIGGVLILYPVCRWYAGVKQRRRDWWLSYL